MDIMETTLGDEINKISSISKNTRPYYAAVVHTPVGDADVLAILNYDAMRDYLVQYSDEVTAVLLIPKGQMAFRVARYVDQLEITISKSDGALVGAPEDTPNLSVNRYRMILSSPVDPALEAAARALPDEFSMDLQGFETVSVQMFEPVMERFAMQTYGNIFRKTPVGDIVRTILSKTTSNPDIEAEYQMLGIDIVEPEDATIRDHVLIPAGTPAPDAVGYVHKNAGGIYPAGLSYYYQNRYWYVFPPYDYTRYNEASRQLIIYRVPENRMPFLENTHQVEGSVISIVATGEFSMRNMSQTKKLADGNGLMFSDASKLFERGVEVKNNKALVSRASNTNEFVSSQQKDGLNNVAMSQQAITANKLFQSSILAAREGAEVQLVWQNANPEILHPGMQTRIYFMRNGQVREVQAVLIGVQYSVEAVGDGIVSGVQQCNAALRFWVNPDEK